jgi:hypothetical protein
MRAIAVAVTLLHLGAGAALADPVGHYDVSGQNPGGGSTYSGSVVVERTGDTYRVTWTIGRQRFVGTGIGSADFIAVSYRSGNAIGLAMYSTEGPDWKGIWAYENGNRVGTERWRRR